MAAKFACLFQDQQCRAAEYVFGELTTSGADFRAERPSWAPTSFCSAQHGFRLIGSGERASRSVSTSRTTFAMPPSEVSRDHAPAVARSLLVATFLRVPCHA